MEPVVGCYRVFWAGKGENGLTTHILLLQLKRLLHCMWIKAFNVQWDKDWNVQWGCLHWTAIHWWAEFKECTGKRVHNADSFRFYRSSMSFVCVLGSYLMYLPTLLSLIWILTIVFLFFYVQMVLHNVFWRNMIHFCEMIEIKLCQAAILLLLKSLTACFCYLAEF